MGWDEYKLYHNKLLLLSRLSKKNYYNSFFELNLNNVKATCEGINNLISSSKKKVNQISIIKKPDGSLSADPSEIPNVTNKHFSSVGHNLASKLPPSKHSFNEYLTNNRLPNSFNFEPIIPTDISAQIQALPLYKSYGMFSCPVKILKGCKHIISQPLANIYNLSVIQDKHPSKLELSKIVPVYKDDDESCASNHQSISLLSMFNRIFEKLMYQRLSKFIIKHNILINSQYGFRSGHNTQHAILDIVNTIQSNMNSGKFTCGLFIDLKKAFDTVDHYILLQKLDFYGIRGIVNDWFRSYLTYRKQTTSNGSYISNSETTLYGVPQGSVLGPLLFLLYVNDIANSSKYLSFYLFADDTSIIYANKNLHNLEQIVNSELSNVSDWLLANKLTLNFKKSNYVLFRPRQKCLTYNPSIKAYDPAINALSTLEKKDFVKYLGVLIDYELSWKNHINLISKVG